MTTYGLTCNNLQPFLSNSFTFLAATPYFLLSLQLLIFTGLFFPKSKNIVLFSVCTYRFRLLPLEADYTQRWCVAALQRFYSSHRLCAQWWSTYSDILLKQRYHQHTPLLSSIQKSSIQKVKMYKTLKYSLCKQDWPKTIIRLLGQYILEIRINKSGTPTI